MPFFFAFNTEIQDGRQKWWENNFWEKSPIDSAFCRNRSIWSRYRDKWVFVFYVEIQDGYQNWRKNDFWDNSPVVSAETPWVKKFVEIAVSRTVSEINAFLYFT